MDETVADGLNALAGRLRHPVQRDTETKRVREFARLSRSTLFDTASYLYWKETEPQAGDQLRLIKPGPGDRTTEASEHVAVGVVSGGSGVLSTQNGVRVGRTAAG